MSTIARAAVRMQIGTGYCATSFLTLICTAFKKPLGIGFMRARTRTSAIIIVICTLAATACTTTKPGKVTPTRESAAKQVKPPQSSQHDTLTQSAAQQTQPPSEPVTPPESTAGANPDIVAAEDQSENTAETRADSITKTLEDATTRQVSKLTNNIVKPESNAEINKPDPGATTAATGTASQSAKPESSLALSTPAPKPVSTQSSSAPKPAAQTRNANNDMVIRGTVQLSGSDAATTKITEAVVYFIPNDKSRISISPGEFSMNMVRKEFTPRVIAAPVGSSITIPNNDSILHNAFSPSTPNQFDAKLYGVGETYSFTAEAPGVIRIYCNVHYNMAAYVLALGTPFYTQPNENGEFILDGLPRLPGQLMIWHERTQEFVEVINDSANHVVHANMNITRRRIPQHTNKFGQSYRRAR